MRQPLPTNVLINPDFAAGSANNWDLETGWSVSAAGCPPPGCTGYTLMFDNWPSASAAARNLTRIAVSPGGVIKGQCWAVGEMGAAGDALLRITFFDANSNEMPPSQNAAPILNNYTWQARTVYGVAPIGAAYGQVEFAVIRSTTSPARWFATNFFGAYLPGYVAKPIIEFKNALNYYINLFTSQYKLSTRLLAWQAALMQPIDDLTNCLGTMNLSFDLDNAFGTQLDIDGEFIGVSRTLPFQPSNGVSPVLDDDTYRLLLYATQAKNTWDGTIESIYQIWQFLFPNALLYIRDNQNMTATISTNGNFTSIEQDLINNGFIVPRPAGVQYNPGGIGPGQALFGFDLNTQQVAGFDVGVFA